MLTWINASLNRKISSLLLVLLSFLLLVIIYSIYKLKVIESEMQEVAEIDIPLSEVMSQVEMLQLRQHLLFEQFRLKGTLSEVRIDPLDEFSYQKDELSSLLSRASRLIGYGLQQHQFRFEIGSHQQLQGRIESFYQLSNQFEALLGETLTSKEPERGLQQLEITATQLDGTVASILQQIDGLTLEAARYTSKHESEFMLVNTALGFCAVVIGVLLTLYIIQVVRRRIGRIQQEISTLNRSLDSGKAFPQPVILSTRPQDELAELELDLKYVMQRLSQEMTSRREVERQLLMLATHDKLTGAYNRHKWDQQIEKDLHLAERSGEFSIIMIDVDFFKKINDQYGHHTGDRVLQVLAAEINSRIRKVDMLFRMGGEEFVILLPQQPQAGAAILAEALRSHIEQLRQDGLPAFTVSIGVTCYQPGDNDVTLLQRADKALYRAKKAGRNQVQQSDLPVTDNA